MAEDTLANWRQVPFVTVKEAARILVCSEASVYGYNRKGWLSFKRVGVKVAVSTADVIAMVDGAEDWVPDRASMKNALAARHPQRTQR